MVLRAAAIAVLLAASPALASNRSVNIAMAVALLDVAEEHCGQSVKVDPEARRLLMIDFHEYDIAGLASTISRELNAFYEDFFHEMKAGRSAFCARVPSYAEVTGYGIIRSAD